MKKCKLNVFYEDLLLVWWVLCDFVGIEFDRICIDLKLLFNEFY